MVESGQSSMSGADALISLFIMLGMRKHNPHQVFQLLLHLNNEFKQPEVVEEAANRLFAGDGAAGKKLKSEIESIDASSIEDFEGGAQLGQLISQMKVNLLENWVFHSASTAVPEVKLEKRTSEDLMAEYKKFFEWKNSGKNGKEISNDPDACLVQIPQSTPAKCIVVSSGPTKYDAEGFWKNVWDQDVKLINCLVDYEGRYANKYFESQDCGKYKITLVEQTQVTECFIVSKVTVQKGGQKREVTHNWFRGWPDFGVPEEKEELEGFQELIKRFNTFIQNDAETGRSLIHCRAGWGRSGTLLTIISQLYMLKKTPNKRLSVKDTLDYMRRQRRCLVETRPQYKLVYRTLEELEGKLNEPQEQQVTEKLHSVFDYYRHDYGKDELSYQLMLMTGDQQTWYRSDDTITGNWVQFEDKIYLNFDYPEEDNWNSGIYKGIRIFQKVKANPDYWECIRPLWNPSTKMITKGTKPSWQ